MIKRLLRVASETSQVSKVREIFLADMGKCCLSPETLFSIRLCLEEALINAITHGNKRDAAKKVSVQWTVSLKKIRVCIRDEGAGFQYRRVPSPVKKERLLFQSGRGLFIIKKMMDEVTFNRKGNAITFSKYLTAAHTA